jgi:putative transcriptional regulator
VFCLPLSKNNLKSLREKSGASQQALAEKVGVTRQTIISIEQGRYVPSLELALKLSKEFKCKVEEIFGI